MKFVKVLATLMLVAAWISVGARGQATIALVQHASKDAGTGTATTLAFKAANIAGNWIGVSVRGGHSGEVFTITDPQGNAYRQAVQLNVTVDVPSGNTLGIFYAENIAGGANTVTVSDTISGTLRVAIFEYSGVATANSLDVISAAQGNGLSPNSGGATTTASGDLLLGAVSTANSASAIAGNGFAAVESVPAAPSTKLFAEQQIQSSAGNISGSASLGAADGWGAVLAAFRASGGAAPQPNITSISPASGAVGTPVTIVGTNFGTAVGTVTFNGTAGTPTSWSTTRVVVPVPSGATSGNVVLTDPGVPSNPVPFTVTPPDTTPPVVSVTAPVNNAVVSGSIPLTATATDSGGSVAFVQFQVDGANNGGQLASAPYNSSLDTTTLPNGTHTLTAVAQDAAGNVGTSAAVTVSVSNVASAPSTIALVQQGEVLAGSGASAISQSFSKVSNAGDLIVATLKWGGQNLALAAVTDNYGNVYQSAAGPTNWSGTTKISQTVYAKNIAAGGAPITITAQLNGASVGNLHLYQFEYSGADAAAPLDAVGVAIGAGTSISVGSLATLANNDLIHAVTFTDSGATNAGAGFQALTTFNGNLVENRSVGAAGTYGATATNTAGGGWFMHALALKPGGGSGGGTSGDTTAPTPAVTAPANNATVAGTITLTATATDPDSAVAFVQFVVDGTAIGARLTSAPYSISFDTTTLTNDIHTFTAVAQDPSANQGTSAGITVTVANATSAAMGPLRKSTVNSRYFVDPNGKPVLLVGSHTWNNLQDTAQISPPPAQDYNAYLAFLKAHNHNFVRLWKRDLPTYCGWGGGGTWYLAPWPHLRTGPGTATDGLPTFDLTQFDQSYFDRLRARVLAARAQGLYVSVMLFDDYNLTTYRCPNDGYPYSSGNNVNGIADGGTNSSHTLANPAITAFQDAYVKKVIDTVNDLDNVLYEVLDEGTPSTESWQLHIFNTMKTYEANKPLQHPIGVTAILYDDPWLYTTGADYTSPVARVSPSNNQGKVSINDTDHSYNWSLMLPEGPQGHRDWVWENFTSGAMTVFMDPYLISGVQTGRNSPSNCANGVCTGPVDPKWEQVRLNMGYTRTYANKMDLLKMTPQGSLSSTGNCLAQTPSAGAEYLVYAPSGGTFTVDLTAMPATRTLTVEWFNPTTGVTTAGTSVSAGATRSFAAPFGGNAVLYLVDAAGHN